MAHPRRVSDELEFEVKDNNFYEDNNALNKNNNKAIHQLLLQNQKARVEGAPNDEKIDGFKNFGNNKIQKPNENNIRQQLNPQPWVDNYFDKAVETMRTIRDSESLLEAYLIWFKLILGPEPENTDQSNMNYEEKCNENSYLMTLAALNVISNIHEHHFQQRVINKYRDHVKKCHDESKRKKTATRKHLEDKILALNDKETYVKLKISKIKLMINQIENFEENLQHNLQLAVPENKIELSNNVRTTLIELNSSITDLNDLNRQVEEIDVQIILDLEKYNADNLIIDAVEKIFLGKVDLELKDLNLNNNAEERKQSDANVNNKLIITYESKKKVCKHSEPYKKLLESVIDGSKRLSSLKGKTKEDLNVQELLSHFSSIVHFTKDCMVIFDQAEYKKLYQQLMESLNSSCETLVTQSVDMFFNGIDFSFIPKDSVDEIKINTREKIKNYFLEALNKLGKSHLESKGWIAFLSDLNLTKLLNNVQNETEKLYALISVSQKKSNDLSQDEMGNKRKQSEANYKKFLEESKLKYPTIFKYINFKTIDETVQHVIKQRNYEPLSKIKDKKCGNTLLHAAFGIYNCCVDEAQRLRVLKVIEILYRHGANALAVNDESIPAYAYYKQNSNSAMFNWKILILQITNSKCQSQFSQSILECLLNYSEKNSNRAYVSSYVSSFWKDQGVKIERIENIWGILKYLEKQKTELDDKLLRANLELIILNKVWNKKDSSTLFTMLREINEKAGGHKILMLENPKDTLINKLIQENEASKAQINGYKCMVKKQEAVIHADKSKINKFERMQALRQK